MNKEQHKHRATQTQNNTNTEQHEHRATQTEQQKQHKTEQSK